MNENGSSRMPSHCRLVAGSFRANPVARLCAAGWVFLFAAGATGTRERSRQVWLPGWLYAAWMLASDKRWGGRPAVGSNPTRSTAKPFRVDLSGVNRLRTAKEVRHAVDNTFTLCLLSEGTPRPA